jgi:hypothetical protein
VIDGTKEVATYPFVLESPVLSADGARMAYRARAEKSFLVVDGVAGPKYDQVRAGSVVFSPGGEHVAYAAATAEHRYVVIDDVVIENGYEGLPTQVAPRFSDESHATYRVGKNGRFVLLEIEIEHP